jgi:MFS family permease
MNTLASVLNRSALHHVTHDGVLLFLTRFVRLFSYGALSVVLVFYLTGLGLSESQTGILLTLTLLGDTLVSLFLTTQADRIGRRRMLITGAILMVGAGLIFAQLSVPADGGHDRRHQPKRKRSGAILIDRASGPVSGNSFP